MLQIVGGFINIGILKPHLVAPLSLMESSTNAYLRTMCSNTPA